MEEIADKNEFI